MSLAGTKVIALVPARGGSKGLARKNLRRLGGRSLVRIALDGAREARLVDEVYLSSDDAEILAEGRAAGIRTLVRPTEWASDTASAVDVVRHFLEVLPPDLLQANPYLVYLQPTSPRRSGAHIDAALQQMAASKGEAVISVVELTKSPFKAFRLSSDQRLQALFDEQLTNQNRQQLPRTYAANGAIYAFRLQDFVARGGFPSNGSVPYLMSVEDSVDVDTLGDLQRLGQLYENP
jgi:CMP-N,N'-diacetyllegionaminic acid synthase